jgi:hypothetical protein
MSYDITLLKPPRAVLDNNRRWALHLCQSFADLEYPQIDVSANADLADDIGMSNEEWVSRGMGVTLYRIGQRDFVEISFWETMAEISLPNFPQSEPEGLLESVVPYIDSLRALEFVLLDPQSDEPVDDSQRVERLLAGYRQRQRTVARVADDIGGDAPGRRK